MLNPCVLLGVECTMIITGNSSCHNEVESVTVHHEVNNLPSWNPFKPQWELYFKGNMWCQTEAEEDHGPVGYIYYRPHTHLVKITSSGVPDSDDGINSYTEGCCGMLTSSNRLPSQVPGEGDIWAEWLDLLMSVSFRGTWCVILYVFTCKVKGILHMYISCVYISTRYT